MIISLLFSTGIWPPSLALETYKIYARMAHGELTRNPSLIALHVPPSSQDLLGHLLYPFLSPWLDSLMAERIRRKDRERHTQ